MIEYVIFGLPAGENRPYMEECLIDSVYNKQDAERIANKLTEHGYKNIRISEINLSAKPDFEKCINK